MGAGAGSDVQKGRDTDVCVICVPSTLPGPQTGHGKTADIDTTILTGKLDLIEPALTLADASPGSVDPATKDGYYWWGVSEASERDVLEDHWKCTYLLLNEE